MRRETSIRAADIRRAYVRDHPLAKWLNRAATILGAMIVPAPFLAERSPALALLPVPAIVLFGILFGLGGAAGWYGLMHLKPRWEAAGAALLAAAFAQSFITTAVALPNPLSLVFLAGLTLGFGERALILASER